MEEKKYLRKSIQSKRDSLSEKKRKADSKKIASVFLNTKQYLKSNNILIFYPFRSEIDTVPIIRKAISDGKKIILPKVAGKGLKLFYVDEISAQLKSGKYGIMEPSENLCVAAEISRIDLAVVPGVCFDRKMNRLGYGGGFYDRLLPKLPEKAKKIALCFQVQIVERIPVEEHDNKVDIIITEKDIYS